MTLNDIKAVEVMAEIMCSALVKAMDDVDKDSTVAGEIISVQDNGYYGVSIDKTEFILPSSIDGNIYQIHDLVWVTSPCGVDRKRYISGRRK